MNRSAASVSISARRIAASGIAWPNEIVAVLTNPSQRRSAALSRRARRRCADRLELVARAAIEAGGIGRVAVQFDDPRRRHARGLVQPVDVLGDDGADLAAAHQRSDGAVAAVGLGRAQRSSLGREAAPPGLPPRLLGGEEIVEIDRRHLASRCRRGCGNRGCPTSVLIPAPVNTTARRAPSIRRASATIWSLAMPAYSAGAFAAASAGFWPRISASISSIVRPRVSTAISQNAKAPSTYQKAK